MNRHDVVQYINYTTRSTRSFNANNILYEKPVSPKLVQIFKISLQLKTWNRKYNNFSEKNIFGKQNDAFEEKL